MKAVTIKISKTRHDALRKISRRNGPTIIWQVNYAVDLYLQEQEKKEQAKPNGQEPEAINV